MVIPDAAVYAGIPVIAGALVWVGRQFVITTAGIRGPRGVPGVQGEPGPLMSVRDYREVSDLLRKELNGRYMMADEARKEFGHLRDRVADIDAKLLLLIRAPKGI